MVDNHHIILTYDGDIYSYTWNNFLELNLVENGDVWWSDVGLDIDVLECEGINISDDDTGDGDVGDGDGDGDSNCERLVGRTLIWTLMKYFKEIDMVLD